MRLDAKSARVIAVTAHPRQPDHRQFILYPKSPFMPRDNDKNNNSRGRRDRPGAARAAPGGKGRSGAARGPEKKFAKRGFAGKSEGEASGVPMLANPRAPDRFDKKPYSAFRQTLCRQARGVCPPRREYADAPRAAGRAAALPIVRKRSFNRDDRPAARFHDKKFGDRKPYASREGGGEKRHYTPRGDGFAEDGDRPRGDRPYAAQAAAGR